MIAAGGYAAYLSFKGREAGSVVFGLRGAAPSPEAQKQAMLNQARDDVNRMTQQEKDSSLGPGDGA